MKTIAKTAALVLALSTLGACGRHDEASDDATPNNVEMPAADLPAAPPSLDAPPPAKDPAADASQAAQSAEAAASSAADTAASVAEAARAAAAEADQQGGGNTGSQQAPAQ